MIYVIALLLLPDPTQLVETPKVYDTPEAFCQAWNRPPATDSHMWERQGYRLDLTGSVPKIERIECTVEVAHIEVVKEKP